MTNKVAQNPQSTQQIACKQLSQLQKATPQQSSKTPQQTNTGVEDHNTFVCREEDPHPPTPAPSKKPAKKSWQPKQGQVCIPPEPKTLFRQPKFGMARWRDGSIGAELGRQLGNALNGCPSDQVLSEYAYGKQKK
ncbi:MAG: hypothetical protein H6727_16310 [Myxococcales bacterium]|nr:hypothetical protein [Myxococcales bacterium]